MTTTIKLKNSVTTTNAPSSLQQGEVGINVTDRKVWVGNAATTPVQLLGTGATGNFSALTCTTFTCTTLSASGVATFSAGTAALPAITTTGDTNTGIYFPAADTIAFTEGGVERLRINANGQTATNIAGTALLPSFTRVGDENTGIFFPAADTIAFSEGGVEAMRIDSAGNVGIGITPTQRLHVSGNILATGSIDCGTQFLGLGTDSATAPSFSFTGDTDTGIFRPTTDQVGITTGGTVRLTTTTAQFTATLPWRGQNGTAAAPAFSASADTNTGIYFPAADTIGFTEGGVEQMRITSTGLLQFNSGYGSVATAFGCRAWVNFDGTGTPAIRNSGNVSSITDNGTGTYTVNFTTAMADANYSVTGWCNTNNNTRRGVVSAAISPTFSTSAIQITTGWSGGDTVVGNLFDMSIVCVAIHR